MSETSENEPPEEIQQVPFQFTIQTMLWLTVFFAVVFALYGYVHWVFATLLAAVLFNILAVVLAKRNHVEISKGVKKVAMIIALTGTVFFEGCGKKYEWILTTGMVPYSRFLVKDIQNAFVEDAKRDKSTLIITQAKEEGSFSIPLLLINITVLVAAMVIVKYWRWFDSILTSRMFMIWFWITILTFNSILIPFGFFAWLYVVFVPTAWVDQALSIFLPKSELLIILSTRMYFLLFLFGGFFIIYGFHFFYQAVKKNQL